MTGSEKEAMERERRVLHRAKTIALLNRDSTLNRMKAIADMASRVRDAPELKPKLLTAAGDLDSLWDTFLRHNDAVLNALLDLDLASEYSVTLEAEVRTLYFDARAIVEEFAPLPTSRALSQGSSRSSGSRHSNHSGRPSRRSRLPEIPLLSFSGELSGWPAFRDRFTDLVVLDDELTDSDRFYYLLGCLRGDALSAISSISVSNGTYDLAWATLVEQFDKPRQLASLIIDKLMSAPIQSQESLSGLKDFLGLFSDQVAMLHTLHVPNLGEFILFSLASRCLPYSTRKGFEAANKHDFPSILDMVSYIKDRVSLLEAVSFTQSSSNPPTTQGRTKSAPSNHVGRKPKVVMLASKSMGTAPSKCLFCSGEHVTTSCNAFTKMSVNDRVSAARDKRLCFRCLVSTHWSTKCRVTKPCARCHGRHHTLLHKDNDTEAQPIASTSACYVSSSKHPTALLGTAVVHVRDRYGCMQPVRALIDSGSQISIMSVPCVERLGLKCNKWTVPLTGVSGAAVLQVKGRVECLLTPRYNDEHSIKLTAWVLPKITSDLPSQQLPPQLVNKFSHLALADPQFDCTAPVELLLGADVYSRVMDGKRVLLDPSLPAAYGSIFGWIVIGPVPEVEPDTCRSHVAVTLSVSLEDMVHRFWQVEEPDTAPATFHDEGQCEAVYSAERYRDITGRYVVPMPFKPLHRDELFPGSRQIAIRRFQNLERKLQADEGLYAAYKEFMLDYESLGHMTVADEVGTYYIPHHPVFNAARKIRVVFDASAKASSHLSLNQCLHTGPKLQLDILDILTRFRLHKFVFTADVCKMYRQILMRPEYRRFQHIFWRSSPVDELKEYQLNTVTYGVNCAPFLALRVLKDIAENECNDYPEVRDGLKYQTYVDDICMGADTEEQLSSVQSDLIAVLGRSALELKKWSSNSPRVLSGVAATDRVSEVINFDDKGGGMVKVLGLRWDPVKDIFGFDVHPVSKVITKRSVLSTIATIFDPIGFLAPVIFHAKHIMQQIWKTEQGWDDPLPDDLVRTWNLLLNDLPVLSKIEIPRFVLTTSESHVELCGFCDASERGYAAVAYLRITSLSGLVTVHLLGSKTKTAPMKTSTIPRLELCAAVLLARWLTRLLTVFGDRLRVDGIFAWSDSQIVLSWLINPHTCFKVFVSNRVHLVRQLVPSCHWGYVRSAENPADCASRGLLPSDLVEHLVYWSGPAFLKDAVDTWDMSIAVVPIEQLPETKVLSVSVQVEPEAEWFSRFSSYHNMVRVVAWMRRFAGRARQQTYTTDYLTREELGESLIVLVKQSQTCWLSKLHADLASGRPAQRSLAGLRPFVDARCVVCVGGRLTRSNLTSAEKQPILLAKESHLSVLIARHWHLVTCHSGPRVITSLITRQFWIISVRAVIRRVIGQCTICVRTLAQSPHPVMADLPSSRVQMCRPFTRVGIDYAGPMSMRECRLRKARQYKIYVAVFVCMATKAVHLEVVSELSTNAFLAAFDRFVARRGLPQDIFSDCGTNFVGAAKYLRALVNDPTIRHAVTSHAPCVWHFNPPSAPHFGGLWEAAVRSFKTLLTRLVGVHNFSWEEMTTVLCRIEAVLNSRPLTPMSSSPMDLDYLTPGHFLIGQPLLAVPDVSIPEGCSKVVNRWKLLHQCHQSFWRRWSTEYLSSLQVRTKWTVDVPNLQCGDMVVVKDQNPPMSWRLGRIVDVTPGNDGVVRVVKLNTATGELTRPVVKLVKLPMDQ
ncbi:unnamed protein product [Macrosiphum euphorbiae]|uniref:Integrase catalytic domain-containing protein n=2 Tax=Macrosiphum euphorbiae TaxID=13131 RepID=A0AAV0WWL9_9HEMI|nr:unnamed protein product [Macrosiphum euphorbiae]